jgi:hypothetical protein
MATSNKIPQSEYQVIADLYLSGQSSAQIAREYSVSDVAILNLLDKLGIKRRSYTHAVTDACLEQIRRLYASNMSAAAIAKVCGLPADKVRRILRADGTRLRPGAAYKQPKTDAARRNIIRSKGGLDPALYPEIIQRYEAGESSPQLGRAFGVSNVSILNILDRCGVEPRPPGSPTETVMQALSYEGRFAVDEPAYFYLYRLRRYPQLLKAGIARDLAVRADDEYGELLGACLRPVRREAFFISFLLGLKPRPSGRLYRGCPHCVRCRDAASIPLPLLPNA